MKALVFVSLFFMSVTAAASFNCKVNAPRDRELEAGSNREVICREVAATLSEALDYNPDARLTLTVTGRSTFSVDLKYRFHNGIKTVRGKGTLYWNPDGAKFVLTSE